MCDGCGTVSLCLHGVSFSTERRSQSGAGERESRMLPVRAKEYQVVRRHHGIMDGIPRVQRQMVAFGLEIPHSEADKRPPAFSPCGPLRSPLCASEGRAAGGGPKDRLGRRRRRRERRDAGQRSSGRRTSEKNEEGTSVRAAAASAATIAADRLFSDRGPPLFRPFVRPSVRRAASALARFLLFWRRQRPFVRISALVRSRSLPHCPGCQSCSRHSRGTVI